MDNRTLVNCPNQKCKSYSIKLDNVFGDGDGMQYNAHCLDCGQTLTVRAHYERVLTKAERDQRQAV